ncbi:MAG: hypothetical protein JXA33_16195, partial [Anaerolineae bacterium]|nr:hypothetical protein [Anaerolineae bacterium]
TKPPGKVGIFSFSGVARKRKNTFKNFLRTLGRQRCQRVTRHLYLEETLGKNRVTMQLICLMSANAVKPPSKLAALTTQPKES